MKLSALMNPKYLLIVLLAGLGLRASAQELLPVEVSRHKAVHLVFSSPVKYCDTGSKDVAFVVTDNIVRLTAEKEHFAETNLTIITEDKRFYSYLLLYNTDPRRLNLMPDPNKASSLEANTGGSLAVAGAPQAIPTPAPEPAPASEPAPAPKPEPTPAAKPEPAPEPTPEPEPEPAPKAAPAQESASAPATQVAAGEPEEARAPEQLAAAAEPASATTAPATTAAVEVAPEQPETIADSDFLKVCEKVVQQKKHFMFADYAGNVSLEIWNIYVNGDYLYFSLYSANKSRGDMPIDFVNFQQGDTKGLFGSIYREAVKKPVYVYNEKDRIAKDARYHSVYVFEKFTIEEGKKLLVELGEKDGKRFLTLGVGAKYINEAQPIAL